MTTGFYLLSDKVVYNYLQNIGLNSKTVIYDLKTKVVKHYDNFWVASVTGTQAQVRYEHYDNVHPASSPDYQGRIIEEGYIDFKSGKFIKQ